MKTTRLPLVACVLVCMLGVGCLVIGGLLFFDFMFPGFGSHEEQSVFTRAENGLYGAFNLLFAGVFLVPSHWLVSRLIYWPILILRTAALAYVLYFFGSLHWSHLDRAGVTLLCVMATSSFVSVACALWEMLPARSSQQIVPLDVPQTADGEL